MLSLSDVYLLVIRLWNSGLQVPAAATIRSPATVDIPHLLFSPVSSASRSSPDCQQERKAHWGVWASGCGELLQDASSLGRDRGCWADQYVCAASAHRQYHDREKPPGYELTPPNGISGLLLQVSLHACRADVTARNPRWQEELRPCSPLQGNASSEQEVCSSSWDI